MTVALVAFVALIASCVQAASGLGFALILTPALFAVMSPTGAILTATALGLMLNLLVLLAERRRPSIAWGEVAPIVGAAVPGSIGGILLLEGLPKPALQIAIGVAVLIAAALQMTAAPRRRRQTHARRGTTWSRLSLGLATGALTTSTGVSGPPLALWLSARGLPPRDLRDSLSAAFLATGVVAALSLLPLVRRAHVTASVIAVAGLCVIGGHAIGSRIFARLSGSWFHHAMLAIIVASAMTSLVLGLSAA
jgi:uncharacterized protein